VSLYTVVPDGSNLVETFSSQEQSPFYLYWSPDSQRVSFLAFTITVDGLILQMVPFDGGETQLLGIGQPYYWAWSPDGQTILIHTGGSTQINPSARLALLNINGEVVESGLNLRPSSFQAPAWSPDGKALLLAAEVDEVGASLLITDVNGEIQTILESVGRSIAFAWSPDGKRVAYIMENPQDDEESAGILVIVDPDSVEDVQTVDQKPVVAFFWSPDSKKIAYFVPRLKIPSGEITQVGLPDPVLVLQLYLTDVYTGESWRLIEFTPTQDFLRIMEFFDQYHRSATIWSPDSQYLVISGMDQDENPGIMVISASQEVDSRIIAPGSLAFWSWK
jgi:Tol biopolymer transport system component